MQIRLTGSAPLSADGALDVKIDGRLDASLANDGAFGRRTVARRSSLTVTGCR